MTGSGAVLATATGALSGSTVPTTVAGVPTVVQVVRGLTVAAGDVLVVQRIGAEWFAVGRAFVAATTPPDGAQAAPNPRPTVTTGTLVVSPVETRSWRPSYGWRDDNTDVYQGEYGGWGNNTGCAFYGNKPRSLAGATVTDAKIRVRRLTAGTYAAQSTTLRLVTERTRPSGAPTLNNTTSGPSLAVGATNNAFDVPTGWVQAMVDGTYGGLAIYESDGSPYVRLAGRGSWGAAFTLTIKWRRG